jgi:peptidyl-prolyl cis-trans isomerase A (cyclophilin A)
MLDRIFKALGKPVSTTVASLFAIMIGATTMSPESAQAKTNPVVVMETSKGTIKIELYADKAPISVKNFLSYVDKKFYDGLVFHRVIGDFMIQGGGFTKDLVKKEGSAPIVNEATNGLTNDKYTVAMARTSVVNSATSQFFINLKDNGFLNHKDNSDRGFGYAVFGKVIDGMGVVDAIGGVATASKNGMNDVPATPVVITKAYVMQEKGSKKEAKQE